MSQRPQPDPTTRPSDSNNLAPDPDWWRDAVVYQIYPRSFADANGDGIGDLAGIASRADYLATLGIDAVWLSPFYPSALADGGYDVDDYRDVDPKIGTLAEFDALVEALHARGIRVIVDIVPNHSSNRHPWFQEALDAPKGSPARARYIFRDGVGPNSDQPPTDWPAAFGGNVWEPAGDGQFYLHLFTPEQPDWNWDNLDVRADFLKTLRFWSDRGVDGFRVDVAFALAKDLSAYPHLPSAAELAEVPAGPNHPYFDRDEVDDIYRQWRSVFNEYDPPRAAVGEVWVQIPARRARYARSDSLGQAFNFDLLRADFDAQRFHDIVSTNLSEAGAAGSSSTWVLSNHDVVRHASRYGLPLVGSPVEAEAIDRDRRWLLSRGTNPVEDRALGLRRARAATLFMLALPGSAYLYQGEELGLREVADLPDAARQDPTFFRSPGVDVGRDGCRVPIPWEPFGPSLGFGPAGAHLPQPTWFAAYAVSAEEADKDSTLSFYRAALRARRALLAEAEAATGGLPGPNAAERFDWVVGPASVLHFARPGGWQCVTNFGATEVPLPPGEVIVASEPLLEAGVLAGATTVWLQV